MSDFSKLPPVNARLLIPCFGGCLLAFACGRFIAAKVFRMDEVPQSIAQGGWPLGRTPQASSRETYPPQGRPKAGAPYGGKTP